MLHIEAGKKLSLQRHTERSEFFFLPNGEVRINLPGVWHVLEAPEDASLDVLEVQVGTSAEEDIEKISETHPEFEIEKLRKVLLNT